MAHAHETLLWASKGKRARHTFNYDLINSRDPNAQVSSVWRIPAVPMREKLHGRHPTQKPLRLVRRAIVASTKEGELVFDPFCGSGTTGVAAKELGRFFVGAEMEAEFAELAGRLDRRRGAWGGATKLVQGRFSEAGGLTLPDPSRSAPPGPDSGRGGLPSRRRCPSRPAVLLRALDCP